MFHIYKDFILIYFVRLSVCQQGLEFQNTLFLRQNLIDIVLGKENRKPRITKPPGLKIIYYTSGYVPKVLQGQAKAGGGQFLQRRSWCPFSSNSYKPSQDLCKLHSKEEPYRFSGQRDHSVETHRSCYYFLIRGQLSIIPFDKYFLLY